MKMDLIRSIKKFVGSLLQYNIPVRIIRVRGKTQYSITDVAKLKKLKGKTTRQLVLFVENRNLPTPPSDAYIGREVQIASSEKGKYKYVTFNIDSSKIEGIDQDMRFWCEVEVQHELNRKKDEDSFFKKHGTTIMVGIVCLICVISMVVWFQQIVLPMMQNTNLVPSCICDVANLIGMKTANATTVVNGVVPPV